MKEDFFINLIKNALPESVDYIGDDTAYISRKDLILTQDTLIEDVHFRKSTISPYYLGRKVVAVNFSDIAAAGGVPSYILISLSMPKEINDEFIKEFYRGVNDICNEHNAIVVGGDLTKAFQLTISVCAVGFGNGLLPASRKNAKIGDYVIVTGNFGSSRAGFEILENPEFFKEKENVSAEIKKRFVQAHINPVPRTKEGRNILRIAKSPALMDASDGLADALNKICLLSNVSMQIDFENIPYDSALSLITDNEETLFKWVLFGGEDYELVGTVSEQNYKKLLDKKIPVKIIGKVISAEDFPCASVKIKENVVKIDADTIDRETFNHFKPD